MADLRSPVTAAGFPRTGVAPANTGGGDSPYDGASATDIARRLDIPDAAVYARLASTMDAAHVMAAEGALAGSIVLADHQTAGRGRGGRAWQSQAGAGIWLTLIERPDDARAIEVLALRIGLHAARVLDGDAGGAVGLKWPNDLYLGRGKLAGVLIEARWQDGIADVGRDRHRHQRARAGGAGHGCGQPSARDPAARRADPSRPGAARRREMRGALTAQEVDRVRGTRYRAGPSVHGTGCGAASKALPRAVKS